MRISRFQGDPALNVTENGADMVFRGGQPVMDAGLHNAVIISLFTKPGWWGNVLIDTGEKIGSDFQRVRTVIDIQTVNEIRKSALDALAWMTGAGLASKISVDTSVPAGQIVTAIKIEPPGNDAEEFLFTANGQTWINQAFNPASERF
jgi:phage gp46-like protein